SGDLMTYLSVGLYLVNLSPSSNAASIITPLAGPIPLIAVNSSIVAFLSNFKPSKCIKTRLAKSKTDSLLVQLPNKRAISSLLDKLVAPYFNNLSLGLSALGTSFNLTCKLINVFLLVY